MLTMENIYDNAIYDTVADEKPDANNKSDKKIGKQDVPSNNTQPSTPVVGVGVTRRYDTCLTFIAIIATFQVAAIIVLVYLLYGHVQGTNQEKQKVQVALKQNDAETGKLMATNFNQRSDRSSSWILQKKQVCFGAKDGNYGRFHINKDGVLLGVKLQHTSGWLTCVKQQPTYKSTFGCNGPATSYYNKNTVGVVITDDKNDIIFPRRTVFTKGFYSLPGYESTGKTLAFTDYSSPMYARQDLELRIWYREDLIDYTEDENDGVVCVKVYAKFD